MFYHLSQLLIDDISALNAFSYITLRAVLAALTSFVIMLLFGKKTIGLLRYHQMGQFVRDDGPETHIKKQGTPTMGGLLILISIIFSSILWFNWSNFYAWAVLFSLLGFGAIGFIDDYKKLIKKDPNGLSAKGKFLAQIAVAFLIVFVLYIKGSPQQTELIFPIFKNWIIPLGPFFILWGVIVLTGSSNAVNLTDGLDGLAILPTVLVTAGLGIFVYVSGNYNYANYLQVPFVKGSGEVAIICAAASGAGLGFLWFNAHPALVFMGDVGSLALGGFLGTVSLVCRQEIVFAIMSGLFIAEALSVVIQVTSYKLTKRRVFRMAPLHHHFELKGWPETRVTVRFWIITVVLVLVALSTLKIR